MMRRRALPVIMECIDLVSWASVYGEIQSFIWCSDGLLCSHCFLSSKSNSDRNGFQQNSLELISIAVHKTVSPYEIWRIMKHFLKDASINRMGSWPLMTVSSAKKRQAAKNRKSFHHLENYFPSKYLSNFKTLPLRMGCPGFIMFGVKRFSLMSNYVRYLLTATRTQSTYIWEVYVNRKLILKLN